MIGINWKVRLRSKEFVIALFAFIGLILSRTGVMELGDYQTFADALLLVLVAGGVIVDPTTNGYADSSRALSYSKPRKDEF